MKTIVFDYVLIIDVQEETAIKKSFVKGINIVTSRENHVGKSSLLKSLYYTLGTDVSFDSTWGKSSKLFIVSLSVDDSNFYVARYNEKFCVLDKECNIIAITDKVSRELAPVLSQIFDFEIYLPEKVNGRSILAPPAFTFLPYYIDQDKGWGNEPFASFLRLDQFSKDKRLDSLYYHFGVYNKDTIEKRSKIDANKEIIKTIMASYEEQKNTLAILEDQSAYIHPADSIDKLERSLNLSKDSLEVHVKKLSKLREELHKLESQKLQYIEQLEVITKYNKIKEGNLKKGANQNKEETYSHECPQCGFVFEDELYKVVRQQYSVANEDFVISQVNYLISEVDKKLELVKSKYLQESEKLKEEEEKVGKQEVNFEEYVKFKGLRETIQSVQSKIGKMAFDKDALEKQNKEIENDLRKNPNKKEVERIYKNHVKDSLIQLKAWDETYDSKIKITKPLMGQGTLASKIILADYIAVFKTLDSINISTPRFSFVVDSPRTKEPSKTSSKDILNLIIQLTSVPQIILATMDFNDFRSDFKEYDFNVIELNVQKALLNADEYNDNKETIELFKNLLKR